MAELCDAAAPEADAVVMELADPLRHTAGEAVRAARLMSRSDPLFDLRLARALPRRHNHDSAALTPRQCARLLHVLDAISEGNRLVLPVLQLARHPDARVRSKAALFLSRRLGKAEWVGRFWAEEDARVRANAVEGIWNLRGPVALDALEQAAGDPSPRVAGNALYGLLLLKHPAAAPALEQMAASCDAARVAAAAWAMGQSGDPSWTPALERLARHGAAGARRAAVRALVRLRRAGTQEQPRGGV